VHFIDAAALNLVMRYAKSISVHHAALFGIGAFTYAVFATNGWTRDIVVCGLVGAAIAGLLSVILALGSLRIAGDYFIVASFAFQLFAINVLHNWTTISRGRDGKFGLPSPTVFGAGVTSTWSYIVLGRGRCGHARLLDVAPQESLRAASSCDGGIALGFGDGGLWRAPAQDRPLCDLGHVRSIRRRDLRKLSGVAQTATFDVGFAILLAAIVVIGGIGTSIGAFLGAALVALTQPLLSNLKLALRTWGRSGI
jgi:branched-chain amino acid transport system permease protein